MVLFCVLMRKGVFFAVLIDILYSLLLLSLSLALTIYTERKKSCTTFHFQFFWFKTDYFKF